MEPMQKPFVVAGPCSAESCSQLERSASDVMSIPHVVMIRCGVWKPRTRPGGFEGMGEAALVWIAEIKQRHPDWRFCCEVARPRHVELAMSYGIDAVWIGARTTADPFSVGEVAQALKGCGIPVLVKNAPMPDVAPWIGAIERFEAAGVASVMAVHRGFATYRDSGLRNSPLWDIPIELRRLRGDLPILCDPSHIAGHSDKVGHIATMAMAMGFDGLMVEVHDNPSEALTDAEQQLSSSQFASLMEMLRMPHDDEAVAEQRLADLRLAIDGVDEQLLLLLHQRMQLSKSIAAVKRCYDLPVLQSRRWNALLSDRLARAERLGLSQQFVKEILEKIHSESIRVQIDDGGKRDEDANQP